MKNSTKDTWKDWIWWLFWALILASCVSYPIRWLFFPELWARLSWQQEVAVLIGTVVGLAKFVVRPYCKGVSDESS